MSTPMRQPIQQDFPDSFQRLLNQALRCWNQGAALSWWGLCAWPGACIALQREMQDAWIAHWGGGVPLDG